MSHVSSTLGPHRAPHSGVFTAGTDLRVYAYVCIYESVYAYVYMYESCASTDLCVLCVNIYESVYLGTHAAVQLTGGTDRASCAAALTISWSREGAAEASCMRVTSSANSATASCSGMHPIAAARVTAYVSIRQHTSACSRMHPIAAAQVTAYVSNCQHAPHRCPRAHAVYAGAYAAAYTAAYTCAQRIVCDGVYLYAVCCMRPRIQRMRRMAQHTAYRMQRMRRRIPVRSAAAACASEAQRYARRSAV